MYSYYLIKYKDKDKELQTFITKEKSSLKTEILCDDITKQLKEFGIEYPTFAIEQIDERQFRYFKIVKGYFAVGIE